MGVDHRRVDATVPEQLVGLCGEHTLWNNKMPAAAGRLKDTPVLSVPIATIGEDIEPVAATQDYRETTNIIRLD
jgi:hypothetical protein